MCFVDFAHTPGALAAALDALDPVAAARGGSLISLFGSPGARDIAKRPMMGRAAGERSRVVVLTDDDPRDEDRMGILEEIAVGAVEAGRRRDQDLFLIPEDATRSAKRSTWPGPRTSCCSPGWATWTGLIARPKAACPGTKRKSRAKP